MSTANGMNCTGTWYSRSCSPQAEFESCCSLGLGSKKSMIRCYHCKLGCEHGSRYNSTSIRPLFSWPLTTFLFPRSVFPSPAVSAWTREVGGGNWKDWRCVSLTVTPMFLTHKHKVKRQSCHTPGWLHWSVKCGSADMHRFRMGIFFFYDWYWYKFLKAV